MYKHPRTTPGPLTAASPRHSLRSSRAREVHGIEENPSLSLSVVEVLGSVPAHGVGAVAASGAEQEDLEVLTVPGSDDDVRRHGDEVVRLEDELLRVRVGAIH